MDMQTTQTAPVGPEGHATPAPEAVKLPKTGEVQAAVAVQGDVDMGEEPASKPDQDGNVGDEVSLPVRAPAKKKAGAPPPPRHRIGTKTPRGLAGRVAEVVSARTTETAGELKGAALAECILQVTGPPSVTRAALKARSLLRWLRTQTKKGSAKVCGRTVSPADVREAEKLVGDVWSKKLIKLQRQKGKSKKQQQQRLLKRSATETSLQSASAISAGKASLDPEADGSSDDGSDGTGSDLSAEEDVDSEVEVGDVESRDEGFVDFEVGTSLPPDDYKGDWQGAPELGSPAFNAFAAGVLRRAGIARTLPKASLDRSAPCPQLQPHQEAAVFLLHPRSPVTRLLVDHPTGSGKTREMIEVLDNYFHDPRPKVPVFPKEPVCRNFYGEMLRWPSKYRDYFCCLRPHSAARASSAQDWRGRRGHFWDIGHLSEKELRGICREMREVLEMKGCFYMGRMRRLWRDDFTHRFPNEPLPAAPLRALRYTSAGGKHTTLREDDGLPASALFKIGFSRADPNVYSNKIVIMDEVHNLVRAQTQFGEQLTHLRELLFRARGMILAGFTGTPILSEPHEGRQLLDIIKGFAAPLGDAGFISSFPMRPPSLFPKSLPLGIPDAVLTPKLKRQFVQKVVLTGESLQRYDKKRALGLPLRRLQRYCSLSVHFGAMHEGKSGSKARVLQDLESCAPKIFAIARDVAADKSKTLVLIARHSGMDTLIDQLRKLASPEGGQQSFGVATMDELAAFNSKANLRGELYRVLVADSTQCGEGVSFFSVRRVMLADVPTSPSALVQAVGRSIRMYGHDGLPEEERTVTTTQYISVLPRWMQAPLGAWAYRALRHHDQNQAQGKARRLLRRLLKAGIPTLAALRQKLVEHFPDEAAKAFAAAAAPPPSSAVGVAVAPSPVKAEEVEMEDATAQGEERATAAVSADSLATGAVLLPSATSDESTTAGSPSGRSGSQQESLPPATPIHRLTRRDSCESDVAGKFPHPRSQAEGPAAADTPSGAKPAAAPGVRLAQPKVIKFLESLGLWTEAKMVGNSRDARAQEQTATAAKMMSPSKRALVRRASKESGPRTPGKAGRKGQEPQHWMVRALQSLLEDEDLDRLVQQRALIRESADELALRSLAQHSREFVPALAELRREAIDREALEALMASLGADRDAAQEQSEGESSVCEFGVSAGSSGGEDDVPPPLVLPPDWQMQRIKRGRGTVKQFVDPAGKRYKTEKEARRAIDEVRRATNMSSRLKERFEMRLAAARAREAGASAAPATAAAGA